MQQLCCSAWQRCWPPYRSVRRIKEAVLQMTEALAKSQFFIDLALGISDSSVTALCLSGGRIKKNLSCRLHTVNASDFFASAVLSALKLTHLYTRVYRDNLTFFLKDQGSQMRKPQEKQYHKEEETAGRTTLWDWEIGMVDHW